jgi:hypothetical protein
MVDLWAHFIASNDRKMVDNEFERTEKGTLGV